MAKRCRHVRNNNNRKKNKVELYCEEAGRELENLFTLAYTEFRRAQEGESASPDIQQIAQDLRRFRRSSDRNRAKGKPKIPKYVIVFMKRYPPIGDSAPDEAQKPPMRRPYSARFAPASP